MREHDGIQTAGVERPVIPVHQAQVFVALKQAAINEYALALMLDQGLGAGHSAGSTKKTEFHSLVPRC